MLGTFAYMALRLSQRPRSKTDDHAANTPDCSEEGHIGGIVGHGKFIFPEEPAEMQIAELENCRNDDSQKPRLGGHSDDADEKEPNFPASLCD